MDPADAMRITMERIDPLLVEPHNRFDQEALRLHLERYEFAVPHVVGRTVVDCACGTGYGAEMLAAAGARSVIGVDISEEAIAFARRYHAHPRVEYRTGDAFSFQPPTPPEVWVTLETVEHLEEPERYLRRVHERLAPSGTLIASVPTTVSTDGNPYHRVDFTPRSWRRRVTSAGFAIEAELTQAQRFTLHDVFGRNRGARQQAERSLLRHYLRHPRVAGARLVHTLTRGLVNEYLVVVARRR